MRYSAAIGVSLVYFSAFFQSNVAADPKLGDMEPLYVFTPGPAPGNCDQYKADILTAFRESIDMLSRSIAAVTYLNQPMPGVLHPLNRRKWKAWAQLMKAVFNIDVDTKKGLQLPSGPAQEILNNFTMVLNAHNYIPPGSGPYKYWFFCSDDFLKYKDPPSAEELQSWSWPSTDDVRSKVAANGYWNATGGTLEHPLSGVRVPADPSDKNAKSYLCSEIYAHAFVLDVGDHDKVLVFCPVLFTEITYPTAAKVISDKKFKKPGLQFEDIETYGTMMSHEWYHLVNNLADELAVDYFGLSTNSRIYGWARVTQTAQWYPDRVRKTPDAFVMFEMAVYYTEINNDGLQYVTGTGKKWSQL